MDKDDRERGQLSTLGDVSRNALSLSGASANCAPEIASMMATRLFGCYRASEANDPEMFIMAATATLACYPEAVARQVCDPVRGLPSKAKWLPAIAEIREACEREMVWHDAVVKREREREHTRGVIAGHKAPVGSPEHRRTVGSFRDLAALWPRASGPPRTEPRDYAAVPPPIRTPEMAKYLDGMRAEQQEGEGLVGETMAYDGL